MIGILCIHGFTGSPKEIEPLVHFIKEKTNWKIEVPILPGHGDTLKLKGIKYESWIKHCELHLQKLLNTCDTVYICGFSMGGLIGSWLAAHYPVDRLILLSPAIYYSNPKMMMREMIGLIKGGLKKEKNQKALMERYRRKLSSTPITAYLQFQRLVSFVKPTINRILTPTFIIQGTHDPIVPLKSAQYLYHHIGSINKKLIFIDEADHIICHSCNQKEIFPLIIDFCK